MPPTSPKSPAPVSMLLWPVRLSMLPARIATRTATTRSSAPCAASWPRSEMHFHSVTFDLDGTLLDTIADLAEACRLMLDEVGAPQRTQAEVHSFVGKGMAVLVERCLTHDKAPTAAALHAAIESFKRHYAAVNGEYCQIYPGVLEGLKIWRDSGLKMGVVTNKPGMFTEA